jgi:hypothetical protein
VVDEAAAGVSAEGSSQNSRGSEGLAASAQAGAQGTVHAGEIPNDEAATEGDSNEAPVIPPDAGADILPVYIGGLNTGAEQPQVVELQPLNPFGLGIMATIVAGDPLPEGWSQRVAETSVRNEWQEPLIVAPNGDEGSRTEAQPELVSPNSDGLPNQDSPDIMNSPSEASPKDRVLKPSATTSAEQAAEPSRDSSLLDAMFLDGYDAIANPSTLVLVPGALLALWGHLSLAQRRQLTSAILPKLKPDPRPFGPTNDN